MTYNLRGIIISILVIGGGIGILILMLKYSPWVALGKLLDHQITVREFFKTVGKSILLSLIVCIGILILVSFG